MFDSNKTWFCKQLRTEDAKQIGEQLNIAISEAYHSEDHQNFSKVKKYMKIRINENYFYHLKIFIHAWQNSTSQKILILSLWELIAFLLNYSMK